MTKGEFFTARFSSRSEKVVATFEVTLANDVAEVWGFLTREDRLPLWLAPGHIELREGGAAQLDFKDSGVVIDSRVSRCEPRRALSYSWSAPGQPDRPVRWTLQAKGRRTLLTLELELPAGEDAARSAAGWAAHLEMLAAALAGASLKFPFPTFQAAREAFGAQVARLKPDVQLAEAS